MQKNATRQQPQATSATPREIIVPPTPDKALTPKMLSSFMDEVFESEELIEETDENRRDDQADDNDEKSANKSRSCDQRSDISEPMYCSRV